MPFKMFKAFTGSSRNRSHRSDAAVYPDYPPPHAYPTQEYHQPRREPQVLRRPSIKRREPVFTPLPSRAPSGVGAHHDGYVRVDSPDAVMGGALNARPTQMMSTPMPSIERDDESEVSESASEREHRERMRMLGEPSRLLDQPPQDSIARVGSYHSGRPDVDDPIILGSSPRSRSPASGSDHTIEHLRTPLSVHPSERVIPPLPHLHSEAYLPTSKSPTDIYGGRSHELLHEVRPYHSPEVYPDRYGRSHSKEGPIYYIIPGGMSVIFQDEHGNEITRVGDFSGRSQHSRPAPFVVQDAHGRELYRYDGYNREQPHRGYTEPQVVRVETYPSHPKGLSHERSRSSQSYLSDSYRRHHDDRHDHKQYRSRDYSHRDHRGYQDYGSSRDPGDYRNLRDHGGYGRADVYVPGRVSSRVSHRSFSHSSQSGPERPTRQLSHSMSDERRSRTGRSYAGSHHLSRHDQGESDISHGLSSLHL
ncbi:hypothetical protein F5I97DRAFT_1863077 [Phlebopus sp. FC_14]|nr:hypothetical protein F5I97DRAFT_1863077 [Phlebopus sp. FC_14]